VPTAVTPDARSPTWGEVAHIGHVELLTPRLEDSLRCFTDVLGMTVVAAAGDSAYLRGEAEYERWGLKLTASPDAGIGHLALRMRSAAALERRVAALAASSVEGEWTEGDFGHGPAFRFRAPGGHRLELYWETERYVPEPDGAPPGAPPLARDRLGRRGGPGIGVRRLDHVNLLAGDVGAAAGFARAQLGFSLYDEVVEDDGSVSGAWLSLGPRPLELVYARDRAGACGRLHHAAFWVDTREEVLRAADIFVDHGVPIEVAPAQHTIGRSFFLYGFEPGGNRIEVTTGADLVLDPDPPTRRWTAAERRRGIGWGTRFPASWSEYGTPDARRRSTIDIPGFSGLVTCPGDPGYDEARAVWNVMHDRRPAAVARCTSPGDVAAGIAYARRRKLTIAVRCGGHSLPGHSTVDGGLVLDLRSLNHVAVDAAARTVHVGGGATLGEVDRGAQANGLVVPAGVVSHTGVGGLTLGGGVGRLMRRFGLTIDSLVSAEVVLADGRIVRASASEQPDLFWGLRGGGGNFGVVTEFAFRAYELTVLPILATFHPLDRAREVLAMGDRLMADPATPDALLWTSFLRRGPGFAPWMPAELAGTRGIMCLIEWSGDRDAGRALLADIARELDAPAADLSDVPYLAIQRVTDELLAPGTLHAYVKAGFATELDDAFIDALLDCGSRVQSPLSVIEVLSMGGAIRRVPHEATAFPHRDARWLINVPGQWSDPADSDAEIAWVRSTYARLRPFLSGGAYSNFMEDDESDAAGTAYGDTLARLAQIKRTYDPENVFRLNQNIPPQA
jgi:catechol 2,3 dioxygenase